MFQEFKPRTSYSQIGLVTSVISVLGLLLLSIAEALLKGYAEQHAASAENFNTLYTLIVEFRYCCEYLILPGVVLFLGGKFLETRTTLSVSFDRLDADKMSVTGPDENNIVWIGRKFESALEAQAVAETLAERLKQSAV